MALAQSLSEAESTQPSSSSYASQSQQQQTPPPANRPAVHKRAQCLYDFEASEANEVSLKAGQELIVTDESDPHWWCGVSQTGQQGFFPASFVTYELGPTPEELAAAAAAEQARLEAEAAAAVPIKQKVAVDEAKLYRTLGLLNMAEPTSQPEQLAEIDALENECDVMLPMIEAMIDAHETAEAELQALNRRFEAATTLHANLQGMGAGAGAQMGGAQMQPWQMQQLPPHMRQGFQMQQQMPPPQMQQYQQQQAQQYQQQQQMPPRQVSGQGLLQQQGSPYTDRRQAPQQFQQQQAPAAYQAQPQAPPPAEAPKPTAADLLGDLLGGNAFKAPTPAPAPVPVQQQQQPPMQQMQQQMHQMHLGGGMPPQQQQPPSQQQQQQQFGGMPPLQRIAGMPPQQGFAPPLQQQQMGGMPPQQQQMGGFVAPGQFAHQPPPQQQQHFGAPR